MARRPLRIKVDSRLRSARTGGDLRRNIGATLPNNPVLRRAVLTHLTKRAQRCANVARQIAPGMAFGSRNLRRSHYVIPARVTSANRAVATFGNRAPYATFVHQGTGPRGGRGLIRPQSAARMVWRGRANFPGKWSASYTRGQSPQPWLTEAFNRVARADQGTLVVRPIRIRKTSGSPGLLDPTLRVE